MTFANLLQLLQILHVRMRLSCGQAKASNAHAGLVKYLIPKACKVGCSTAFAFDPQLATSGNPCPYEFVYVCIAQLSALRLQSAASLGFGLNKVLTKQDPG